MHLLYTKSPIRFKTNTEKPLGLEAFQGEPISSVTLFFIEIDRENCGRVDLLLFIFFPLSSSLFFSSSNFSAVFSSSSSSSSLFSWRTLLCFSPSWKLFQAESMLCQDVITDKLGLVMTKANI